MTARRMRENTFRFLISHKLWMMTNAKPGLDHVDEAIRGRLHIIPFDRRWNRPGHPEPDCRLPNGDKHLMEDLKKEAEGILAWLVRGAVEYKSKGLSPPMEVSQMTTDFFREVDVLGRWREGYEECDVKEGTKGQFLFDEFVKWRSEESVPYELHPNCIQDFSEALQKRGIKKKKFNDGMRYGLRKRVTDDGGEGES
jgi:phage/plasmid-associated DNA primase